MLEFFQDNVIWLFYVLFFVLMLRSKGTTATNPETPESRSTSGNGHSH